MQLIMPTLVLIGLTNIMGIQILVPTGREKQVLFSEIVGAVVNVVVNSLLIPQMGAAGAAIGTVLAELAVLVVQIVALGREILPALAVLPYLKTGVALAAAVASVWWLLGSSLHPFVVLAASAVLFFAAYGVLLLLMGERMVRENGAGDLVPGVGKDRGKSVEKVNGIWYNSLDKHQRGQKEAGASRQLLFFGREPLVSNQIICVLSPGGAACSGAPPAPPRTGGGGTGSGPFSRLCPRRCGGEHLREEPLLL